ncbi:serine/threonine-protein kinase, partial [Streptomyces albus]
MTDAAHVRLDLPPGYRVGEWVLKEPIGTGSWGVVHAAESAEDGAEAAVKLLPTHLLPPGQRASMEQLVRREVRFSLETDHPHVVRTREVLTVRDPERPELDGATALVMDRAARSLQDALTERADDGPAPLPDAPRILAGVGAGLAHIHQRGWVHGDLKPGNVLLAPDGEVWLGDFGLTVELDGTHAYVPPLGSLDHVPPEWWSDREGGRSVVRPTADIWAFGVLAHQVLTGGLHPFPGSTPRARALAAQAYARGTAELRLENGVPEGWRALIADCLRPDHASRAALDAGEL